MSPYRKSLYALNRNQKGIIYQFSDAIVEVKCEEVMDSDDTFTEAAFEQIKSLSDQLFRDEKLSDWRNNHKHTSLDSLGCRQIPKHLSAEDEYFTSLELKKEQATECAMLEVAKVALNTLSRQQRRRFLLHAVHQMTVRQIARIEGVSYVAVHYSITSARKKIDSFLNNLKKEPLL